MFFNTIHFGDPDMTFQVGLTGRDGLVVASDCRAVSPGDKNLNQRFISNKREVKKIFLARRKDFVCAASIHEIALDIGRRLAEAWPETRPESNEAVSTWLRDTSSEIIDSYRDQYKPLGPLLIIGLPNAPQGIIRMRQITFCPVPVVSDATPRVFGGDGGNPAIYFAERFQDLDGERLSVDALIPLAAHSVLESHKHNPTYIGNGIDVLVCRDGQEPYFMIESEIAGFRERSEKISEYLKSAIFDSLSSATHK